MRKPFSPKLPHSFGIRLAGCLLVTLFLFACGGHKPAKIQVPGQPRPYRVRGIWYQPLEHARDFIQQGRASWYGKDFHGRTTASGETYDMHALSAAHKTLPMGTFVRVFNLDNERTIDVRVNDRGPFVRGRIIDLSYAAAKAIDMIGAGTAKVKIEALGAPRPVQSDASQPDYLPIDYYAGNFSIQVGAFTEKANAERMSQTLNRQYPNAHITKYFDGSRTYYRVRVGKVTSLEQAEQLEQRLARDGYPETIIVAE